MTTLQQLTTITKYIDIQIEVSRIRLGVDPSGIKPSKFITYFDPIDPNNLANALNDCISYLKLNNPYFEELYYEQRTNQKI